MIPAPFEYHAAPSVSAAIALLQEHGDEAKILAGGQSLIPLMRFRLSQPEHVIDIGHIPNLAYIREHDDYLAIGALTREADLETDPLIAEKYPILVDASSVIADPLVRNLATVGGNLAHADPANDHPAVMLALDASIVVEGAEGQRTIPIDDFFVDTFVTSLEPDELLLQIWIPRPAPLSGAAYVKLERKVGDFAIAGVAANVTLGANGRIEDARIGLTNVAPMAIRAKQAEESLANAEPDDAALQHAGSLAAQESQPSSDLRGPAEYKRAVVRTLTSRALQKAIKRAWGNVQP